MRRLASIAIFAASLHGEQPAVKALVSATAEYCAGCADRTARFAITPPANFAVAAGAAPKVLEASLGNLRAEGLARSFHPRWEMDGKKPVAILIGIDPPLQRAGTYNIALDVGGGATPLTLQIEHAAAKLAAPDKLIVERTVYWPFSEKVEKMELALRESSRHSDVTGLQIESRNVMHGKSAATVGLAFPVKMEPLTIPPGEQRRVDYLLSGDFPLDTVTGSVQVTAPQLADPVTFPFEVRSRLWAGYLLLVIVPGLFLSWYLKVYIANREKLQEARVPAARLLAKVKKDWDRYADETFRKALQEPLADLRNAVDAGDPKAMEDECEALDTAWRAAVKELDERRHSVVKALDAFRRIAEYPLDLPPSLRTPLDEAKTAATRAKTLLDGGDPDAAQQQIDEASRKLDTELPRAAAAWVAGIRELMQSLASAKVGLPATVMAQLAEAVKTFDPKPPKSTGNAGDLLDGIAADRMEALAIVTSLKTRLGAEWQLVEKTLPLTIELPKRELFGQLHDDLFAFVDWLRQGVDAPAGALAQLGDRLSALQKKWEEAIRQQLTAPVPTVEKAIGEQNFVAAIEEMARVKAKAGPGHLGNSAAAAALAWPSTILGQHGESASGPPTILAPMETPESYDRLALEGLREIRKAKAVRTLVAGVLITVWAFGSYSGDFVGTIGEMVKIFFAAFSLDVTLDALGKVKG